MHGFMFPDSGNTGFCHVLTISVASCPHAWCCTESRHAPAAIISWSYHHSAVMVHSIGIDGLTCALSTRAQCIVQALFTWAVSKSQVKLAGALEAVGPASLALLGW